MGIIKVIKRKVKTLDDMIRPLANGKWDYFVIITDFLWCRYVLKISADEYLVYNFHNLKHRYRKYFLLQRHRKLFININTRAFTRSKYTFYKYIPDLFSRELIIAPFCGEDTFIAFLKKHQKIVVKPDQGSLGKGLEVVKYTGDEAARTYFSNFTAERPFVCEEFIKQHPALSQLNPASVNTLRIYSLLVNGEVEIISAALKTGAGDDNITDNLSLGGIGAQIDIKTGIVCTFGKNFKNETYTHHPTSGASVLGLQIPNWQTVINLIIEAHKRIPQCMLYGWDIAITETGADIVEANSKPGIRNMQEIDGIPKGKKILPLIKKDQLKEKRLEYETELMQNFKKYGLGQ